MYIFPVFPSVMKATMATVPACVMTNLRGRTVRAAPKKTTSDQTAHKVGEIT